jgi:LysM repeat protein
MKPTLLFATLSMVFVSPTLLAKSELETLRARCAEQERQIQQLEQDNMRLRSATAAPRSTSAPNALVSNGPTRAAATPKPAASGETIYTVKAGDSFEKIAQNTGVSAADLVKLNRLKPNAMIHPGQKLKLVDTTAAAAAVPAPARSAAPAASATGRTYQIRSGDTYSSIARNQKVTVASLIAANPTVKVNALRVGQTIRLDAGAASKTLASTSTSKPLASTASAPVAAPKPPAPLASESRTAAAPTIETANADSQESLSPTPERKFRTVTIDGEMTYGDFASQNGTDTERLNALNGLDLINTTVLAKGSELYVPARP